MKPTPGPKVLQLSDKQVRLAEKTPTGFLIALWLDPETADKLALTGGVPADQLHITLAYCGDAAELGELNQAKAITAVDEAVHYWSPISGRVSGYGRFDATESSDEQDVFYATPDIPQLIDLRSCIVNCLMDSGIAVAQTHGYTPHITLSYLDTDAPNPTDEVPNLDLTFKGITIMAGTRRIDVPFWTESWPMDTIGMSEDGLIPADAPLDSTHFRAMFGAFDKEWIPFLPVPNKYVHEQYGDMDLTSTAYDQMLLNFKANVFKQEPPIRATHIPADGGAIGWITDMRKADDGSLEVKPRWNELGQGLVDGNRFQYVSAEFCKVWTNPVTLEKVPNVAVGLALVTRPHFKTDVLRPLSQSEAIAFAEATAFEQKSGSTGEGNKMTPEEEAAQKLAEAKAIVEAAEKAEQEKVATQKLADEIKPTTTVLNNLQDVVLTAEDRQKERQMFADLQSRVELAERRATSAEGKLVELQKDRLVEKFTAEVTGRSAENGVAWFGSIEENVRHMVSLAQSHGVDSTEVQWAVKQKRTEAAAIRKTGIFDPLSLSSTDDISAVNSQITQLADQHMKANPGVSREAAETWAIEQNPELYVRSISKK